MKGNITMEQEKNVKKGGISVETEHIFPIIKKWLYSDKDIFLREIVSNACDAVTKLRRLASLGHFEKKDEEKYRIDVTLDSDERTITVSDNGIGMNADELDKYLCSIALSGALDFINKYEGENSENNGIIGHFGLGFYSSFMVSDKVTVESKSYDGSGAVRWTCLDSGEYTLEQSNRQTRGTDVIMHISEDGEEYLNEGRLREILEKYCSFMPVEIFFNVVKADDETLKKNNDEKKEPEEPKPVNDINPLWMRNPSDCSDEDYRAFYRKVFRDYREPLFWIHINADYPLNFKGILYFPKIDNEYESLEGQVKLFYNQVFVADNIKEVIPEFLLMLRGVIDCPELPLNVSRSYLQNSGYVAKISKHIVKKVADKLNSLFNNERENFEKLWRDLKIFVEYGSLREAKFYDRIKESVVYELCDGKYKTLGEYLDGKDDKTVYYCNDKSEQANYISMLEAQGIEIIFLDRNLDNQFISMVERENKDVKFLRVDAAVSDALKEDGEKFSSDGLVELFRKVSGNDKLEVTFENLKDKALPALLTVSEEERRFGEMMKMYGMGGDIKQPDGKLVLNSSCGVIRRLADSGDDGTPVARQIWSLAVMAQRKLTADELKEFLSRSYGMLDKLF